MSIKSYALGFAGLTVMAMCCSQNRSDREKETEQGRAATISDEKETNVAEFVIVNNAFASRPFRVMPTIESINQVFGLRFELKKIPIKNSYKDEIDTIYLFAYEKSRINFYKSNSKSFFQDAQISNSEIVLSNNIAVGMGQTEICKLFNAESDSANEIVITDDEEIYQHRMFFENGVLITVSIGMGVD